MIGLVKGLCFCMYSEAEWKGVMRGKLCPPRLMRLAVTLAHLKLRLITESISA